MNITKTKKELQELLANEKVGFVPTMGALHEGHLDLVRASKERGLYTVVCIFVNPTQFNEQEDFEKYPVNLERDLALLEAVGCDVTLVPSVDEVYSDGLDSSKYKHDFGPIAKNYEGAYRPGHFDGVGRVVHILFEFVRPQVAFFGEKDFQQLAVIQKLSEMLNSKIEIVGVPTKREESGLAMSSRNLRLSSRQLVKATQLYESLVWTKKNYLTLANSEIIATVKSQFLEDQEWSLEYFDLINPRTFEPIGDKKPKHVRAVIACKLGDVRLLDNIEVA